ncbi:CHAD domain-containing protein [Mycolicibacterium sp. P9-64]|nr:CHAD domain-containing protein [Mycolicibacterium sp. P9-64]
MSSRKRGRGSARHRASSKAASEQRLSQHRAVTWQVAELLRWDRAVHADVKDSVHQMRVTTRTIRSLLEASGATLGPVGDPSVTDELRWLATLLGRARDAEVLAERYTRTIDDLPMHLVRGPIRQRLSDACRREYSTGWQLSVSAMRSDRYFRLLEELRAVCAAAPPSSQRGAKRMVAAGYERVRKRVKAAGHADPAHRSAALHAIRKSAKRLRYTAAAVGAQSVSKAAADVQVLLGDHQDSVVSQAYLITQADDACAAGEDTFTYGLLYCMESDRAQRCEQGLDDCLKSLDAAVHGT